jgi:MFS family permease
VVLILFLKDLKSEAARAIPWRQLSMWAIWGLVAFYVTFFAGDRLATAINSYNTAIPLKTLYGVVGISALLGGPFSFGMIAVVFGVAWYYGRRTFGEERIPRWRGMPREYYRDALLIGVGGAAGILGLRTLLLAGSRHGHTVQRSVEASFGSNFGAVCPGVAAISEAVRDSLLYLGLLAAVAAFTAAVLRPTWLRVVALVAVSLALVGGNWIGARGLFTHWAASLALLGVAAFGVRWVMRLNIFGGFLVLAILSLAGAAAELLRQPDGFYRRNGYVVMAALIGLILWPLVAWRTASSTTVSPNRESAG